MQAVFFTSGLNVAGIIGHQAATSVPAYVISIFRLIFGPPRAKYQISLAERAKTHRGLQCQIMMMICNYFWCPRLKYTP
jgi:hypothetical protein